MLVTILLCSFYVPAAYSNDSHMQTTDATLGGAHWFATHASTTAPVFSRLQHLVLYFDPERVTQSWDYAITEFLTPPSERLAASYYILHGAKEANLELYSIGTDPVGFWLAGRIINRVYSNGDFVCYARVGAGSGMQV